MNLNRLTTFCRVYELGSFSQAAERLYLSQPTVSSHILVLEEQLGQKLFDRIGRLIAPTQAGKILYARAVQAIQQVEFALEEINALRDKVAGLLVIGASTIPAYFLLPRVLQEYNRLYPDVSLQLRVHDSEAVSRLVASAQVDMGIIGSSIDEPDLASRPLVRDNLVLLGRKGFFSHTGQNGLTREDVLKLPWIVREQGSGTRRALEQGLRQLDLRLSDLRLVATVDSTVAVLKCIQAGLGVTITSRWAAEEVWENDSGIQGIDPGWAFERSFYIVWHRQRSASAAANCFSALLERHMGRTEDEAMLSEGEFGHE
jgi:DNA-binding transcriptional LysR family regulator